MTPIRKLQSVVFAGPLGSGSTSGSRLRGVRDRGLDVIPLDTTSWSRATVAPDELSLTADVLDSAGVEDE